MRLSQPVATCSICGKRVPLATCKMDEYGHAVHEPCGIGKLALCKHTAPARKPPLAERPGSWRNSFYAST
jgi:hypothetical protein